MYGLDGSWAFPACFIRVGIQWCCVQQFSDMERLAVVAGPDWTELLPASKAQIIRLICNSAQGLRCCTLSTSQFSGDFVQFAECEENAEEETGSGGDYESATLSLSFRRYFLHAGLNWLGNNCFCYNMYLLLKMCSRWGPFLLPVYWPLHPGTY